MNTNRAEVRHQGHPRAVILLLSAFVWATILLVSCSTVKEIDSRKEAVTLYRYQGLRDELIVEAPKLSPSIVRPGSTITREIKITVLSPQQDKRFKVTEVTTLSGSGLSLELSKQTSEKTQGSYVSTIQVTMPKDLSPGAYTLITTVSTEDQQMKQRGTFQVEK